MTKERRRAPRIRVNLRARWEGNLGQQEASVTSLSTNGCFVLSGGKVEPKELVRLEIMFPDDAPMYMWAEVVEEADEIGFAMQFTLVEDADQVRLGQFVQKRLTADS
jgi:PilZ domain-containing protein